MALKYLKITGIAILWGLLNAIFYANGIYLSDYADLMMFYAFSFGAIVASIIVLKARMTFWSWIFLVVFLASTLCQTPYFDFLLYSRLPQSVTQYIFQYSSQLRADSIVLAGNIAFLITLFSMLFSSAREETDDISVDESKVTFLHSLGFSLIWISAVIYLSWSALIRHATYHSKAWDLAIFAQLVENMKNGVYFETKVRGLANIFSDHFNPIIYIFSPFLYLYDDASRLLLTGQAFFLVAGVIPTYLLTLKKTSSRKTSLVVGTAYLILPVLQFINLADFHPIACSIPFMLFMWYWWECRKYFWMYAFMALAMCCQEEAWILVGSMGLFILIFERERIHGTILTIIGFGGFIALILWFFPHFREGTEYFYFHRYGYLGGNLSEIAVNIVTNPKLWIGRLFNPRVAIFCVLMLVQFGFMPIFRAKYLLLLLPTLFYSALSVEGLQTTMFAQYAAPYVPFLMIATIYGIAQIRRNSYEKFAWIFLTMAVFSNVFLSPLPHGYAYQEAQLAKEIKHESIERAIKLVSDESSVSAGSKFAPHLIRRELYLFPDHDNAQCVIFDLDDYHDTQMGNEIKKLLGESGWKITYQLDNVFVMNRDESAGSNLESVQRQYLESPKIFKEVKYTSSGAMFGRNGEFISDRSPIDYYGLWVNSEINAVIGRFIKSKFDENRYLAIIIPIDEMSMGFRHQSRIDFRVVNLGDNVVDMKDWVSMESDGWVDEILARRNKERENIEFNNIFQPIRRFSNLHSKDICGEFPVGVYVLIHEYPDGYPNTLEEFFLEEYIQGRMRYTMKDVNVSKPKKIN